MREMMMKKTAATLAVMVLGALATDAIAQEQSPWLVRARVVNIAPANNSDPVAGVGAADRITVSNKTMD